MRSPVRPICALGLALLWSSPVWSAPKSKPHHNQAGDSKKSAQEIAAEDGFQKQMDWENKLLGPNTEKKIDHAKIQKLQAEETARREKQDKIDRIEKERKDREAALAAQRADVKAPSSREVPEVEEAPPPPPKPAEKHDDAFVDKLLKDGKSGERKRVDVSSEDVDELLAKAKQDKAATIAPKASRSGRSDSVDQLLATTDNQQSIKTTVRKPAEAEPVSAEAAARETTLRAIAAANAKAQEERNRNKRPAIPDAAMLRNQRPQVPEDAVSPTAAAAKDTAGAVAWKDPFANEAAPTRRSRVSTSVVPASSRPGAVGRHAPSTRPSGGSGTDAFQDPFNGRDGGGAKARPAVSPKAKARKRSARWKDPFA